MKIIASLGAVLALTLPVTASAVPPNSIVTLVVNSDTFDGSKTSAPKWSRSLAPIRISTSSTVQLDGDVPPEIIRKKGGDNKTAMSTGAVLAQAQLAQRTASFQTRLATGAALSDADNGHLTYCAPVKLGFTGKTAPCLIDSDGDSRFDHVAKSFRIEFRPDALAMTDQGLAGVSIYAEDTLPAPIPYHRLDSTTVPSTDGIIEWRSDYNRLRPGAIHYVFALSSKILWSRGSIYSEDKSVTFNGTPVETDLLGITITIMGTSDDGTPIYSLKGKLDNLTTHFMVQNVTNVVIFLP